MQAAVDQYTKTSSAQDLLRLNAAREQLGVVLAPFMGYRTEAGRALNILRKIQADFADAQAIVDALGDGNDQAMKEFARQVKRAGSVADALSLTIASYNPTFTDQFREYWINAILSGPWTHAVNLMSNTAWAALELGTELGTAAISPNMHVRSVIARMQGMAIGHMLGAHHAWKALKTEEPVLDQRSQIEVAKRRAIKGRLGRFVRAPGAALMAEDEFAKAINYTGELFRLAMDEAIAVNPQNPQAEFQRILASYENNRAVKSQARAYADRMTFQTKLGRIGGKVMMVRDELGPLGWMTAPFIRTPTNILKSALEYTPVAMGMSHVREAVAAGGRDQDLAMARMAVGTAVMIGIINLVAAGLVTGAGPSEPKERELWLVDHRPYSWRLPGSKTWHKYNRFAPIGMVMGLSADMGEMWQTANKGELEKIPAMVLSSIMLNLADQTYARGMFDMAEALLEPKRYMNQYLIRQAASVIPNVIAQVARAGDPFLREARSSFSDELLHPI